MHSHQRKRGEHIWVALLAESVPHIIFGLLIIFGFANLVFCGHEIGVWMMSQDMLDLPCEG